MRTILTAAELRLIALIQTERSGRQLARIYRAETGREIPHGSLYTLLRRLRARGLVTMRRDQYEDGRVRFFFVTEVGRRELERARLYYAGLAEFGAKVVS